MLAVGIHVALVALAVFLLKDYVQSDQPTQRRLTQQQFDEVIRESPVVQSSAVVIGNPTIEQSPAWAEFVMTAKEYQTLPIIDGWSWKPDLRPTVPTFSAGATPRSKRVSRSAD